MGINKLSIGTWVAMGVATLAAAATVVVVASPKAKELRNINLGNKYLAEMDYENAKIAYNVAISIDPNSKEAMEGLMQTSYASEDYETLKSVLSTYVDVALSDGSQQADMLTISKMIRSSYSGFDSPEAYAEYVNEICDRSESEEFEDLRKEAYYASAASLMNKGEYDKANEVMDSILDKYPEDKADSVKANVLEKCAEDAWKKRDFEGALELLKKALEFAKDDKYVKDDLLTVIEDYATECKNHQDYEHANELVSWLRELRGDNCLDDIAVEIAQMEDADITLQGIIEQLNVAFDADDIDTISDMMLSDDFTKSTSMIRHVLYSSNLRQSGDLVSGKGTAIYNVNGYPYVYYGDYSNGKRNGTGLWYYASNGYLYKGTINWENDLPNGPGTYDEYVTSSIRGYGGVLLGEEKNHVTGTFTASDGICVGEYTQKGSDYKATWMLDNGYAPRIEVGDYPSYITQFMETPYALSAYVYNPYGSSHWWRWTGGRWTISGMGSLTDSNYRVEGIDLSFE